MAEFWVDAQPFIFGLALFAFALLVRAIIYWILHNLARDSKGGFGNLIIRITKGPSLLWCFLLGAYLAVRIGAEPSWEAIADKLLLGVAILSVALVIANIVGVIIRFYAARAKMALPISSLSQTVAKTIIILVGSLVILDNLDIDITSILATLGIASLAVALALQTPLSNIFSGAFVIIGGHLKPNDFVVLDSGVQGYVYDITWGSTKIKTLSNNMVIVPNSKLAQAIVTNYNLPEKRVLVIIKVNVSYESDPELVQKLMVEEAKGAIGQVPGLLGDPAPIARFIPGFGETSLGFTLICHARDFADQGLIESELRNKIFKRFRAQGIKMPAYTLVQFRP